MKTSWFVLGLISIGAIAVGCAGRTFAGASETCEPTARSFGASDFTVDATEYTAKTPVTKTILILPPTGGTTTIDRRYAKLLCSSGFSVFILNKWTEEPNQALDFGLHQRFYGRGKQAVGLILEKVQTSFIGLVGTSVGALHASVAAASFPKINAAFLIVGGAPISEVIVTSDQQAMVDLKNSRAKKYGTASASDQERAIENAFTLEPLKLPGELFKKQHIGMVIALQDTTVATVTQIQLEKAWRPETVIRLNNGHFWAIIKTWLFHSDELVDFFNRSAKSASNT